MSRSYAPEEFVVTVCTGPDGELKKAHSISVDAGLVYNRFVSVGVYCGALDKRVRPAICTESPGKTCKYSTMTCRQRLREFFPNLNIGTLPFMDEQR
ncbi:MAG: hypothetical protein V1659_00075 [Candidatus Woesearchaeota archaeon]